MRTRPQRRPAPGPRPPARRAPRRAATLLALLVGAAGVLGGCSSARSDLGTADSNCYVALPAALGAVHHHGKLRGVLLVGVATLRHRAPLLYEAATAATSAKGSKMVSQVCLVAFGGTFSAGSLTAPVGRPSGHLAVVELSYPANRVLATQLVERPPLTFGHSHL